MPQSANGRGTAFVGGILNFFNEVKYLFLNGAVGDVLNSERVTAFVKDAKKAVDTWSDGKYSWDDITATGNIILGGGKIAVDFMVAGVTDM